MADGSLLAHRDFRLLLLGQTTSQFGTQVSAVAVPLLAVLTLRASPLELGLITASSTLAFAVIGLPAGAWLDRLRRRPVLIASELVRALLLATIPLAALVGVLSVSQLIVVSLLTGVARVFFDVGYQSYVPSVIGRDRMLAGNSAMETVRASGQIVGPGLGGWLVTLFGAAAVVLIQALTFAASAVSLMAIRTPEQGNSATTDRPPLRTQIGDGLAFVGRNLVLRSVAIASAASNFAFAISAAVSFIFLSGSLGLTATAIGLIIAAGSVAAMVGAAITPRVARFVGSARIIWLSLGVTGPFTLLVPLGRPGWSIGLVVLGIAAGDLGQIVYAITSVSLRQRLCPEELLGRVTATMRFLIMGAFPLGGLLGGVLGELVGPRVTLWVCGVIIVAAPIPLYRALGGTRNIGELPDWHRPRGSERDPTPDARRLGGPDECREGASHGPDGPVSNA